MIVIKHSGLPQKSVCCGKSHTDPNASHLIISLVSKGQPYEIYNICWSKIYVIFLKSIYTLIMRDEVL